MKRYPLINVLLLATVLLVGCETAMEGTVVSVESESLTDVGDVHYLPAVEPAAIQVILAQLTPEERRAFTNTALIAGSHVVSQVRIVDRYARPWQEVDADVRGLLAPHQGRTGYLAEQFAALEMLRGVLLRERVTPAVQEAIGFYTQLLLKNESPDASVVLRALEALKGYWPEAARRAGASATARHAEAWLATKVDAGKAVDEVLAGQPNRGSMQNVQRQRLAAIRGAVGGLQALGR